MNIMIFSLKLSFAFFALVVKGYTPGYSSKDWAFLKTANEYTSIKIRDRYLL